MTALGVLLLILKIIGIILLAILALIVLICFVPVGVTAIYSAEGPQVIASVGPLRLTLIPKPKKKPKDNAGKKPKKEKKKKSEKTEDAPAEKPKRSIGGMIPLFKELLGIVVDLLSHFRRKLKIKELTLHLVLGGGGDDPAKIAGLYGMGWAAIGNLWTVLERVFIIKKQDVQANVDFFTEEHRIYVKATATIFVGAVLWMGILYGLRALRAYLKYRKTNKAAKLHKKGGIKYGTSGQ